MNAELRTTELMLERGVRVPIRSPFFMRWLGKKQIYLTVTSPLEGALMAAAEQYLRTGLTLEELEDCTAEQALSILRTHGKAIERAVACVWLNGYWSIKLFARLLAWYLRWHCEPRHLLYVIQVVLIYGGVQDFMTTTRSVRLLKVTEPNLGQSKKTKGS
jgi:hypothetical protein